jgi:hypothetical protein
MRCERRTEEEKRREEKRKEGKGRTEREKRRGGVMDDVDDGWNRENAGGSESCFLTD